jgi:SOUL heme-binding protein
MVLNAVPSVTRWLKGVTVACYSMWCRPALSVAFSALTTACCTCYNCVYREFTGFATAQEVQREVALLRSALATAGWEVAEAGPGQPECQLLQYNPPYALPFVRRNEVVLRVKPKGGSAAVEDAQIADVAAESDAPSDVAASSSSSSAAAAAGPAAASPATSYLDGL